MSSEQRALHLSKELKYYIRRLLKVLMPNEIHGRTTDI